jgi:hypothetical protein
MSNRRSRRRSERGGGDELARLHEEARWSGSNTWRDRRISRPTSYTWRGMRDIMGAAALLLGIMMAAIVAITAVVFVVLALVHLLST